MVRRLIVFHLASICFIVSIAHLSWPSSKDDYAIAFGAYIVYYRDMIICRNLLFLFEAMSF